MQTSDDINGIIALPENEVSKLYLLAKEADDCKEQRILTDKRVQPPSPSKHGMVSVFEHRPSIYSGNQANPKLSELSPIVDQWRLSQAACARCAQLASIR